MAHRGRLSVLAHNLGRSVESILAEFEGAKALDQVKAIAAIPHSGTGDVKYHHGAEGMLRRRRDGEQIKVRLYPNPSHLEFVDPVVTGGARAAQTEHSGPKLHHNPHVAVPVLLHGDAAFPGQGVVAETLNLQSLAGYSTGGTIHLITDNQVGFTTDPEEDRSTPYAGDMAKGFNCPIIHVNADDVEACIAAIRLAMAYREQWGRDVVIDLIGYRRYGHNETDEPAYTQPKMAAQIKEHPPVSEIYAEQLVERGRGRRRRGRRGRRRAARASCQGTLKDLRAKMEAGEYEDPSSTALGTGELDRTKSPEVETAVSREAAALAERGAAAGARRASPSTASCASRCSRRIEKLDDGRDRVRPRRGARLRLAAHRGHPHPAHRPGHRARHVLAPPPRPPRREDRAASTCRSRTSSGALAPFELHNSPLSEAACLGFEYGYSAASPESADPLGGAVRRLRQLGPGDHRQLHRRRRVEVGPDDAAHAAAPARLRGRRARSTRAPGSSASSSSAAEGNIRLANPTTAAQYFHLLRRQARIAKPRPLVVFTPEGPAAADGRGRPRSRS